MFRARRLPVLAALALTISLAACGGDVTAPDLNEGQGYNNSVAPRDTSAALGGQCTEGQGFDNRC